MSETQDARTETERRDTDVDTDGDTEQRGQARPTASA